jgi:hypothetical protein|tara:strand:+ start:1518 stop:2180 length:663 start_codon:yes stop_codon:yes gene_type:complete
MGSKMLTGSMMLGGMILGFIMMFLETSTSETDTFAVVAQQLIDSSMQTALSGAGMTIGVLAGLIGTAYLARSMQGENKPGSDIAGLASVVAFLAAAIIAVSSCLQISLLETSYTDRGGDAAVAYAISEGMSTGAFAFIGVSILLLGIAIVRQKNLNLILGAFTGLFGVLLLIGGVIPAGDPSLESTTTAEAAGGIVWFIGFLGWFVTTMVIGGFTIKQAR